MQYHFFASLAVIVISGAATAQDVQLVADNARGNLSDASLLRQLEDDADPQDFIAAARADYRRLLTALYAEGYYGGTISITIDGTEASTLSPLATLSEIDTVVITVDSGPRFKFGQADITPLPPQADLPDSFASGRTARSGRIESAVSAGLTSWHDLGYARARVDSQQITAQHEASHLDVAVTIATGRQLTFGALSVGGNENVRSSRIKEIAGLPTGDVYSPDALEKSESRLRRTGAFDSVAFTISPTNGPNDTLPVDAQVVETKPRRFGFGLELSSIEGLTLSSFWLHRNLLGGAERFRVDGEVSGIDGETGGIDYSLSTTFTRPATFGADTDFFVRSEISRDDEPNFLLDSISVETGVSRIINEDLTVEAAIGVLRASEQSDVGNREFTLFTLPLKATLDRRDDPHNAMAGYYVDVSATPFISFDDEISGVQLFNDNRIYQKLGTRVTLAARGQLGSVIGADLDEAPAEFLFFSGGGGTVRGHSFQSLGIDREIDGETVSTGGASFAGVQLEARVSATDAISVVGFYDAGYVGETEIILEDGDWQGGVGLGLRYNTGIGPIRLDIGTEADDEQFGESLQFYIGIGQAF